MIRSRVINTIGLTLTGTVLVIVLITKFTHGAYIAIIAMAVPVPADEGHPPALRHGRPARWRSTPTTS